jgi:sterol 3beta-glucosyltransferase
MAIPSRFKPDEEDDEKDVTGTDDRQAMNIQKSLYGLIGAAAQGKGIDGRLKLDLDLDMQVESESDGEADPEEGSSKSRPTSTASSRAPSARSSLDERRQGSRQDGTSSRPKKEKDRTLQQRTVMKPMRERSDSQAADPMTQSQILPPKPSTLQTEEPERPASPSDVHRDVPLLDRKLKAKAKADMESSATSVVARRSRESMRSDGTGDKKAPVELPVALAEIFQFDEPEKVIKEYPCWYLQNVLLQGYMYITEKHICFYAYMQKKSNKTVKSGYLNKRGKTTSRFKRQWFTLKGDILSYYTSAADPYFPAGVVDLRHGISAELAPEKGKSAKETTYFNLTTDKRTYNLKADSVTSAKEWVKQLQKVIFRSHNDGDSVKISMPIVNVVDVESNPVIEFADTIRLRVIDNEETYAVDEYFFTFFSSGKEALETLNALTENNEVRKMAFEHDEDKVGPLERMKTPPIRREMSPRSSTGAAPPMPEGVRSTLSPRARGTSPRGSSEGRRSSAEHSRSSKDRGRNSFDRGRGSFDRGRRSASNSRLSTEHRRTSKSPLSSAAELSTESFHTSREGGEAVEEDMSASVMLSGDNAFRCTTLRMPQPRRTFSGFTVERLRRESQQMMPSPTSPEAIRVQPPTRTHTEQTITTIGRKSTDSSDGMKLRPSPTPTSAMRILATPLQQAFNLFDYNLRDASKALLGSTPREYYNKISTAVAGGQRQYSQPDGLSADDRIQDAEEDMDNAEHERRFREHFALPDSERLVAVYYCWLHRVLPLYGKIYIGTRYFCFRSLLYGTRTKLKVAFKNIVNLEKEKGFRLKFPGMVVVIRGSEEIFFDFSTFNLRDSCVVTVLKGLDSIHAMEESMLSTQDERLDAEEAEAENVLLQEARKDSNADHDPLSLDGLDTNELDAPPILFDDPEASFLEFKPKKSLVITCLTIGSRGDVQPYIALCKGLMADGHKPRIATHAEFGDWVKSYGIDFMPVEGDPAELMRICVENGMFTPSFIYETNAKSREWLDGLLNSAWEACQGSDVLIESPSAMAGVHIAEALDIPYFRAFTMPWTRTRAYPHAFAVPMRKLGGVYNVHTYNVIETVFWHMTASQVNRWRYKTVGLKATSLGKMQTNKIPFLYNFSPSFVVPPLDFSDWVRVTGYWFLDEGENYTPPADLMAFIEKARADGMKLVYIGFGSVTVSDSRALTQQVIDAVRKADVRCILSKGWSDRLSAKGQPEVPLPDLMFQIKSAPHDWLFRQVDAAVHHGGAGTTGASLRAGIPTLIKPFFGDQYFSATRVEDLGVGMHLRKITVNALGKALWIATHDERMRQKAKLLGEQIRSEDGVGTAIKAIYRDLEYARTLIAKKRMRNQKKKRYWGTADKVQEEVPVDDAELGLDAEADDMEEDEEESWTFVEQQSGTLSPLTSPPTRAATAPTPATGWRRTWLAVQPMQGKKSLGEMVFSGKS